MSLLPTSLALAAVLFTQSVQATEPAVPTSITSEKVEASAAKETGGSELTAQVLYQFLVAEIAGQRGQWALATAAYLDLAKTTRDVRIARRAAEMSLHAKQYADGIEAGRLWLELAPDDPAASVVLASLYVATQKN